MLNSEIQEYLQEEFPQYKWHVVADLEWVDDPYPCRILATYSIRPGKVAYAAWKTMYPHVLTMETLKEAIGPEMVETLKRVLV